MNIKEVQDKNVLTKANSAILNSLLVINDLNLPPQIYFSDLKEKRIKAMDRVIDENKNLGDIHSLICELRTHVNDYTGSLIIGYGVESLTKTVVNIANIFDKINNLLVKYKSNQDLNTYYKPLQGFSRGKLKNMLIKDLDSIANKNNFSYDKKQVVEQF